MSVACRVPFRLRLSMSQTLIKLCNDDSRWVRISACQILGPYISTFAARFNEMAHNQYGELVYSSQQGNELRYNFDSVVCLFFKIEEKKEN